MAVEVTHVSARGIWVLLVEHELFLPYEKFPWFLDAPIAAVLNVEHPGPGRLRWPDLDIDLSVASIEHPDNYPLLARDAPSPPDLIRGTACDFLRRFMRFEFALKRGGYIIQRRDPASQEPQGLTVDWRRFARENEDELEIDEEFLSLIGPLVDRPPAKQIVNEHGELDWQEEATPPEISLYWLLSMTYQACNNLFHGGKWPPDPARDIPLLKAANEVLERAVSLHPAIRQHYHGR